jgi:pyruvate kinase
MLRKLFSAGVNVVRLNFSHGSHPEFSAIIADVRKISKELGLHVAVLQDLPGPKVRTSRLAEGLDIIRLAPETLFELTTSPRLGTTSGVGVNYPGLVEDVEPGKKIFLADGAIQLRLLEKTAPDRVLTRVEVGGNLRGNQGVSYPDGTLNIPAVTDRDFEHLAFGVEAGVDWVAISFVRSPEDVLRVKKFIADHGRDIPVIAKIEKHEALECIDEIVEVADAIMVARGDLGIEIPLEQVPLVQKDLIARANRAAKPVITATQMLESMIYNPRPTRAEANDVANAILDGTDAVMLSGETALGSHPLEAVQVMATIASEVERKYPHHDVRERRLAGAVATQGTSISDAAERVAEQLGIGFIVTGTSTGNTARLISSFRPRARIIALTPFPEIARRMSLVWGIEPLIVKKYHHFERLIEIAEAQMLQKGLLGSGDHFVLFSGMPIGEGGTNVLKIHTLP